MKVALFDRILGEDVPARIDRVKPAEMSSLRKGDWQFNWRQLFNLNPKSRFFKISLTTTPDQAEGLLMMSIEWEEMVVMNNLEIVSHNLGSKGRYGNVAGCLIAYACSLSFTLGKDHYAGFLSFKSKTALIELYTERYGAQLIHGQNMCFDPQAGKELIRKYLGLDYNLKTEEL